MGPIRPVQNIDQHVKLLVSQGYGTAYEVNRRAACQHEWRHGQHAAICLRCPAWYPYPSEVE